MNAQHPDKYSEFGWKTRSWSDTDIFGLDLCYLIRNFISILINTPSDDFDTGRTKNIN